jgi:hypothetical protein
MCGFELFKELFDRPALPLFRILQTLSDALPGIGARGNIEQALICPRILHDRCGFALYREDKGTLGSLDLLHEVSGPTAKSRQGLNVVL